MVSFFNVYDGDFISYVDFYLGDIVQWRAFGKTVIILNSEKIANDLLEKRSSIYSDRPPSLMISL